MTNSGVGLDAVLARYWSSSTSLFIRASIPESKSNVVDISEFQSWEKFKKPSFRNMLGSIVQLRMVLEGNVIGSMMLHADCMLTGPKLVASASHVRGHAAKGRPRCNVSSVEVFGLLIAVP
jgi:hypothetical protein